VKILLAIDEKASGALLCDYVLQHVWRPNCTALVLHVIEPYTERPYFGSLGDGLMQQLDVEQEAEALEVLNDVGKRLRLAIKDNEVGEKIAYGSAKDAILNEARKFGADLIVVGSRGLTGFTRFIVGSVSSAISAQAPCSVFLVRPQAVDRGATSVQENKHLHNKPTKQAVE
jgi:nucleotide-binding universal stress UspA family protein